MSSNWKFRVCSFVKNETIKAGKLIVYSWEIFLKLLVRINSLKLLKIPWNKFSLKIPGMKSGGNFFYNIKYKKWERKKRNRKKERENQAMKRIANEAEG